MTAQIKFDPSAILSHLIDDACERDAIARQLEDLATTILVELLVKHGNEVGPRHSDACRDLMRGMSRQALGIERGRRAYAMPCGGGKTTGVVAHIAAAHRLKLALTFSVAAGQVLSLAGIRRDLIAAGVDPAAIGFRHSMTPALVLEAAAGSADVKGLTEAVAADTGPADFPIMLVTHSRMRGGREAELFRLHKGEQRSILVWDETLLSATGKDVRLSVLTRAIDALDGDEHPSLTTWLQWCLGRINAEIAAQSVPAAPSIIGLYDGPDYAAACTEADAVRQVPGDDVHAAAVVTVRGFRDLAATPLSVALTRSGKTGDGLIRFTVDVSPELENIAILDASHAIRLLGRVGVIDQTTAAMRDFKRYDRLTVRDIRLPASRATTAGEKPESRAAAVKVAQSVAEAINLAPIDERVLIFTFKDDEVTVRRRRTPLTTLKKNLSAVGIEVDVGVSNKARILARTWGQETSSNSFGDCKHVILAGVIRRGPLNLAASFAGESNDLAARADIRELSLSEVAHCVLQAAHRGNCRRVDAQGQAGEMTLTIIDTEAGLRDLLEPLLPGVNWLLGKKSAAGVPSRTGQMTEAIRGYLAALPATTFRIAIRKLKEGVGNALGRDAWRSALDAAVAPKMLAGLDGQSKWYREGASLIRA